MSKRGRDQYRARQRALNEAARSKKPPSGDLRPRQTDAERAAAEAAFAELLARQRATRQENDR